MYLWIKAFHIVFMVTWMAGLFYIFRLYVYHVKFREKEDLRKVYELMESRLIHIIMNPSMFLSIVLGFLLLFINQTFLFTVWLPLKIVLVAALVAYHLYASWVARKFARGEFVLSEKSCRMINEIPGLLLIAIVILVVVKPFSS